MKTPTFLYTSNLKGYTYPFGRSLPESSIIGSNTPPPPRNHPRLLLSCILPTFFRVPALSLYIHLTTEQSLAMALLFVNYVSSASAFQEKNEDLFHWRFPIGRIPRWICRADWYVTDCVCPEEGFFGKP